MPTHQHLDYEKLFTVGASLFLQQLALAHEWSITLIPAPVAPELAYSTLDQMPKLQPVLELAEIGQHHLVAFHHIS